MRQSQSPSNPEDFAQATPNPDQLGSYRGQIVFAIGQLDTHVQYLSRDIKTQNEKIDKLAERSEKDLKEKFHELSGTIKEQTVKIDDQKSSINDILNKVSEVKGAFYTSRWFIGAASALVAFLLEHFKVLGGH